MPPPAPPPGLPSYEDAVEEAEILAVLTDLTTSISPLSTRPSFLALPTALCQAQRKLPPQRKAFPEPRPSASSPNAKSRKKKRGYAVFSGWRIGASLNEVIGLVSGVPNSLYQGYETLLQAQAAFEYAQVRGWTRVISPDGSPSASIARPPSPVGFSDPVNALHATRSSLWYVVYAGITPGVYASSLECSLNTLGLRSPAFESCESKEVVIRLFQEALAAGNIRKIYPSYT
ncbi:hypothetical protein B0H16DRAFT_1732626 [Mycena metata]|uniref:Uncharacterized protein n=1 Tax=Mycena metata TaxID=1033252 RepID=A0AAD7MTY6_9AGAR|nr:hypothetical protein B0H16DRAFT_1732626 [Mycena metata]